MILQTKERKRRKRKPSHLERVRREIVSYMLDQQHAITGWIKQTAALGQQLPSAFPDWNFFKLGTEEFVYRMTPTFTAIWDKAGSQFARQVGLDPSQWDVTNPYLAQKIQNATFAFCSDTNATTTKDLQTAYADLRAALYEGRVAHGEALPQLTKRVQGVFEDAEKWRARRIAQTESTRAMFQAKDEQAKRSNVVVGWRWSLSRDACPTCVAIAARKPVVKLGEPFAIIGNNPTYSTIYHPPAHPHCGCSVVPILDTDPPQAYTDRPLEQPAPATDEEADKIRSRLREEEEEILRGSEAWGAKPYEQRYPRGRKRYRIPFYSIKAHAKARSKLYRIPT
jgi:hypothetical protein